MITTGEPTHMHEVTEGWA